MKLEWKSTFETGNEVVDLQHRYFIDLIKRIEKTYRNTTDGHYKRKLIMELKRYAIFHFTSEENIATSLSFPVRDLHDRHKQLLEELKLKSEGLEEGSTSFDKFFQFLIEWFSGHTYYEDKKFLKINHNIEAWPVTEYESF